MSEQNDHKTITLTFEETFGGGVKVSSNPTVETIGKMLNAGYDVPAFVYASAAINAVLKLNQEIMRKQTNKIEIII